MKNSDIDLERIKEEYLFPDMEDDDRMEKVKSILRNRLTLAELNLLIIYLETGSYAGLARNINCSLPTARKRLNLVIKKIKECYGDK